jgi:hypothetical protein
MKKALFVLIFAMLGIARAEAANPTLYFTDLTSGPVGAIVTVYGANLVPSVTVSGVSASVVLSATNKVSFVVPNVATGSIKVGSSNVLPFTVRGGSIHYVATTGSDSNSGTSASPWKTIPHGFDTAVCGDIVYVMNGVTQTATDNYGASLAVMKKCTQAAPLALIGYPGATVTIGSVNGAEFGIRNPDVNGDLYNGMVFANLVIRGSNTGMKITGDQYWRVIGNDFSCPNGGGQAACAMLDESSYVTFLGNSIHDTGAGGTKYYHSFYATTNSNNIEVGWNDIYNNKSCRGIQFYSTSGSPQYNLIVHDNIVTGQQCDGINFSTVNAALGPIQAYNNLVYHVGLGGTTDGTPNYACIASLGYGTAGGTALFYGNTLADCGSAGGNTAGAITVLAGSPQVLSTSNLVIQKPGEVVYSPNTKTALITSSHNTLLTTGTANVVNSVYQLIPGSPALGAGIASAGILYDLAGNVRPQSGTSDSGAFLSSSATVTPVTIAPTNFVATVASSGVAFSWSYTPTSVPVCTASTTTNCVTGFQLSEGSTVLTTVAASTATGYSYNLTATPSIGVHTYTLTANLASGSTNITSQPVTTTATISAVTAQSILTVKLTGTLSDGTTFSISGPVTLSTSTAVTGVTAVNASVSGTLPSGSVVSATGALTVK